MGKAVSFPDVYAIFGLMLTRLARFQQIPVDLLTIVDKIFVKLIAPRTIFGETEQLVVC